jgi:hypothetical protein
MFNTYLKEKYPYGCPMNKLPEFCEHFPRRTMYNWWVDYLVVALQLLNERELKALYRKLPKNNCPNFEAFHESVLQGRGYWYVQYYDPKFSIDLVQKMIVEKFK